MTTTMTATTSVVEAMPVLLGVDEIIDWLLDNDTWWIATRDDWTTMACRVDRNSAPDLLDSLDAEGLIHPDVVPYAVSDAWESAESPLRCLDHETWEYLWEAVGYIDNGMRADRPDSPLVLYRGGHPDGWSWTDDLDQARWFAQRKAPLQEHPAVYRATVDPNKLYGRIHDPRYGRGEREYGEREYMVRGELLIVERVIAL